MSLLFGVVLIGCQQPDTRITIQEYLELEGQSALIGEPVTTAPAETPLTPWTPGPYEVGTGDVVTVTIAGLEQLGIPGSHTVRVNDDGVIVLPNIGEIEIGGMSLNAAEQKIQNAYSPRFIRNTRVTMRIAESAQGEPLYKPVEVIVLGEVRVPASIQLRRDKASALQAILAAGGPTNFTNGQVTLIPARDPDTPITFNLRNKRDIIRSAQVGTIDDADVLIVERRGEDFVYVQGLVTAPGPVPITPGGKMSVLQAISAAGGTLLAFEPKEGTLIRRRPNGDLLRVKLDIQRLKEGQEPDLAMMPGDIVTVPHTGATRFEEFLAKSFVFRFGADTTFNPWTHYYFKKERETQGQGGGNFVGTFGNLLLQQSSIPLLSAP